MLTVTSKLEAARRFYNGLASRDLSAIMGLWAQSATIEMPYAPPGFLQKINGVEEIRNFWRMVTGTCISLAVNDLCIYPVEGRDRLIATYNGYVERLQLEPYSNSYVCFMDFDEDIRICRYIEYFNPIEVIKAFGNRDANAA